MCLHVCSNVCLRSCHVVSLSIDVVFDLMLNINFNIPIHFTNRHYHQYIIRVQASNNIIRNSVVAAWSTDIQGAGSIPTRKTLNLQLGLVGPQNVHIVNIQDLCLTLR